MRAWRTGPTAGSEAALWLASERLTLEHRGEALERYEVEVEAATGRLREVGRPRLFEAPVARPQQRLFASTTSGRAGGSRR